MYNNSYNYLKIEFLKHQSLHHQLCLFSIFTYCLECYKPIFSLNYTSFSFIIILNKNTSEIKSIIICYILNTYSNQYKTIK